MYFALGALAAFATLTLLVALGGLAAWLWHRQRALELLHAPTPPPAPEQPRNGEGPLWELVQQHAVILAQLQVTVDALPGVWNEAADRAQRAEDRARKAAASARKKSRDEDEEPELELQGGDGGGGAPSWVQPVSTGVASSDQQAAYLAEVRRQVALAPLKA